MSKIGFFRAVEDEAGFRQILCTSSSHIARLQDGTETADGIALSTKAIRSINRRLADPRLGVSDGVIITILAFACHAVRFADPLQWTRSDNTSEGGLQALGSNPAIRMVLFWYDIESPHYNPPPHLLINAKPASTGLSLSLSVQRAIEIFKSIKHGNRPGGSWVKLRLEPGDFPRLKEQLEADDDLWGYIQDKIRFDYDPDAYEIVFRMHTGSSRKSSSIDDKPISRPDIAAIARDISFDAHTDIELRGVSSDESYGHRSPDAAFRCNGARYPSIIIETSFSHAWQITILGSYGNIKMVVGLDIEYRGSKRATVSVWESDMGLDEDGTPYLRAKKTVDDEVQLLIGFITDTISIPYATLHNFLEAAERGHQEVKGLGRMIEPPPGLKRMRCLSTPEEQLEDDDGARFAASEDEAERKAYKADGAWGRKKTR
ncbi:MAG: hypothetical protein M1840_006454 [Geoglossum simile]|nr:MAG: hypothetical protein M1840_006454 [Geoglossum simile]